jgi:hypothetical protein
VRRYCIATRHHVLQSCLKRWQQVSSKRALNQNVVWDTGEHQGQIVVTEQEIKCCLVFGLFLCVDNRCECANCRARSSARREGSHNGFEDRGCFSGLTGCNRRYCEIVVDN